MLHGNFPAIFSRERNRTRRAIGLAIQKSTAGPGGVVLDLADPRGEIFFQIGAGGPAQRGNRNGASDPIDLHRFQSGLAFHRFRDHSDQAIHSSRGRFSLLQLFRADRHSSSLGLSYFNTFTAFENGFAKIRLSDANLLCGFLFSRESRATIQTISKPKNVQHGRTLYLKPVAGNRENPFIGSKMRMQSCS